ncbi:MAG: hypothetical protein M3R35_07995 [Candidatus Eremiobacteraeota bacterium]|nr:hypothetical protein [Candidatus Eremiobacteraeota bacterium]
MRREARLGRQFSPSEFERAFLGFQQLYHVRPLRALCSPDVLERYCVLYERSADDAHRCTVVHEGVPLAAAVLPAGTIAFEGEVEEDRMGDW